MGGRFAHRLWSTDETIRSAAAGEEEAVGVPGAMGTRERRIERRQPRKTVLFSSLAVLDPRIGHTTDALSPFISVILTDSSTLSPVHVLMLSIQAVRGLPRLRAPAIVQYLTITFDRCFS